MMAFNAESIQMTIDTVGYLITIVESAEGRSGSLESPNVENKHG